MHLVLESAAGDVDGKVRGGQEAQRSDEAQAVLFSPVGIARLVVDVSVTISAGKSKAGEKLVLEPANVDRHIEADACANCPQVSGPHGNLASQFVVRLDRGDAKRAADRVFPEQSSLRSTQNLHGLNVDDIEDGSLRSGKEDAIDVETNAGVKRDTDARCADTANRNLRRLISTARLDGQVGREFLDLVDPGDVGVLEICGRKGCDCDRGVLQQFVPLAGGHHDLFDPAE